MDLAKTLKFNYVFRGVPQPALAGLAASAEIRSYNGGDVLVRQFERSSDLLILLEGAARIKSFTGDTVAEFGPGSMIGEVALIDDQPRSATVIAVGHTQAAVLSGQILRAFLDSDPEIARIVMTNLSMILCKRLRSMNDHLDELHISSPQASRKKAFGIFRQAVAS